MSSSHRNHLFESTSVKKKRARTDISSSLTSSCSDENASPHVLSSIDVNKRVKELSNKLLSLDKEFPEVKYIASDSWFLETAVFKTYRDALLEKVVTKEAKKRKAQSISNREKSGTIYSLPDEVLQSCLAYIGKGHYGVVGLASKKLNEAYKIKFGNETAYLEMATSVNLATYCLNELCKMTREKDEMLRAAAVNGNVDILRAAVRSGLDLFPLVEMKKERLYYDHGVDNFRQLDEFSDLDEYDEEDIAELKKYGEDVYFTDEDETQRSWSKKTVKLSKLAERGHLHVLKYLHEELNYKVGLQRYCKPAIQYGQLEILEWLHSKGYMEPNDEMHNLVDFFSQAVKAGKVITLVWMLNRGFDLDEVRMSDAIRSKSVDMIQICFDFGGGETFSMCETAIRETKSLDVYRKLHELGYEFKAIHNYYDERKPWEIKDSFEIINFLRSISIPWSDKVMSDILRYGTLEMIRDAHEDGCPWSNTQGFHACLNSEYSSLEKCIFLLENGCPFDYDLSLVCELHEKEDQALLELFVGKDTNFDNALFKKMVECGNTLWLEGISFMLEKGKEVQNFSSIEEVFALCQNIKVIQYFHSLGLPWALDNATYTVLLSKIACFNKLDDVKWAYENGCKGGQHVPLVKEEWESSGIRERKEWKANRSFFQEKGLLSSMNTQEIGDSKLDSKYASRTSMFFRMDYFELKSLVDRGFGFRSKSEKDKITKGALNKCFKYPSNHNFRKRLALFQQMGVRES